MRKKAETIEVKVGQVWEDCDKRMNGRRIEVESVDIRHAYCRVVTSKRPVRILIDRMRPTSTGFRLVRDVRP